MYVPSSKNLAPLRFDYLTSFDLMMDQFLDYLAKQVLDPF